MVRINYARHLPIIGALILLVLLVPGIYRAYYRLLTRPALLRAGAVECGKYHSPYLLQEESFNITAARNCDIVLPPATPSELVERYYAPSGKQTILRYNRDTAVSVEDSYLPTKILIVPFACGFLFTLGATIHKARRTGVRLFWRPGHPSDESETLLYLYGLSIWLASFCAIVVSTMLLS